MPARSPRRSAASTAPANQPSTARRAVAAKAQRVAPASAPAGVVGKVSAKGDAMAKGRRGAAPAPVAAATSAMALYEQVKDFIARKIQEGAWRAGDRLPSESELVTQFGISRMTVNRALRELSEQGRIVRVAGVGSFVAEDKPQSTLLQIANLASEIRQRGHDYRCDVLAVERISATPEVAAALDLRGLDHACQRVDGRHQKPAQVQPEFLQHADPAMGAIARIAAIRQQDEEVVKRAIELVLAHVAPMRGRAVHLAGAAAQGVAHLG